MATENTYDHRVQAELLPVSTVTIDKTVSGVNALSYYITKVNWNGETSPYEVLIADGPNVLSGNSAVKLTWDRDPEVDYYKIYGRIFGTDFGLLSEIVQPQLTSDNPYFVDDGTLTPDPSEIPPSENTTGREKWDRLLFKPGKNLQAAELNDVQLIQTQYLERLGNAIYQEGDIIEGCMIYDNSSSETLVQGEVFITAGKIFLFGKIQHLDATDVFTVPSAGETDIGILANKVVVTSQTDPSLNDPAINSRNYNRSGSDALEVQISWVNDVVGMLPIYHLQDGGMVKKVNVHRSPLAKFTGGLAEAIYDNSGDFILRDIPISLEDVDDITKFAINIEPGGIFYLKGNKVKLKSLQVLENDRGVDTQLINGAGRIFNTSTKLYSTNLDYVAAIGDVVAQANKTDSITKGQPNSVDNLTEPTGISATDVYYGATHYVLNTDYLFLGDQISWIPGGSEPSTGVTYTVEYIYSKTMVKGVRAKIDTVEEVVRGVGSVDILENTDIISINSIGNTSATQDYDEIVDYIVSGGKTETSITSGAIDWSPSGSEPGFASSYYVTYSYWDHVVEGDYVSADSYDAYESIEVINSKKLRDYIDFRPSGTEPLDGTLFTFDYEIYLGRIDLLYFDYESFAPMIWRGQPSENPKVGIKPLNGFVFAQLIIPPYTYSTEQIVVKPENIPVYTMDKINKMNRRVENIEYFILLDNLEKDALYIETPALKKGIFTDSFFGHDKVDFGYKIDQPSEKTWIGINKIDRFGHLPLEIEDFPVKVNTSETTAYLSDEGYSLPYTNQEYKSQPLASSELFVQPYEHVELIGKLKLFPSADSWFDTETTAKKRVVFDQTNHNLVAYGDVGKGAAVQWDSWRTLSTGVETIGNFTTAEQSQARQTTEQNPDGSPSELLPSVVVYNEYQKEKTTQFQERMGKKIAITPETITQDLGERVIDTSVVPKLRQIPIRVYAEGLLPNKPHILLFNDIRIPILYSYDAEIPTDIPNPYDSGLTHYNNFLELQDFYTSKIPIDATDCVIDPEDSSRIFTNAKGKAAFTFMIPENTLAGNIGLTFSSDAEEFSTADAIFYGQGFQQIKQDVSASIKQSIQVEDTSIEKREISTERDVLVGVSVKPVAIKLPPPPPPSPLLMMLTPIADPESVITKEDTASSFQLTCLDPLPSLVGNLSIERLSYPSHGDLSGTIPNLTYTPDHNYTGNDSFKIRAKKTNLAVGDDLIGPEATVSIKVLPYTDPPTVSNISINLIQGQSKVIPLKGIDPGGSSILYTMDSGPRKGTIVFDDEEPSTTVKYNAGTTSKGTDSFRYHATNLSDLRSNTGTISITIKPKEKPCQFKHYSSCKGICNWNDWYAKAQDFWSRFYPIMIRSRRHKKMKRFWYWFPNLHIYFSGSITRSRAMPNRHVLSESYYNHVAGREINQALSRASNAKKRALKAEWLSLYNCFRAFSQISIGGKYRRDPIAQSFFINDDNGQYISGVGVYFKNPGDSPVKVELREQLNGYPSSKVLASKIMDPADVGSSDDGSVETFFEFDDLVWLKKGVEVSFSVFTPDIMAKVFQAKLGESELVSGNVITKQPASGVLFKSPNQITWISEPLADLKFKLYSAAFIESDDDSIVEFDEITGKSFSVFCFDVPFFTPSSSSLVSEYSVDGGTLWKSFIINENVELGSLATRLKVRIKMKGIAASSPIIKETASVKLIKYEATGRYIMRTMETSDNFTNMRIIFQAHKDIGTTDFDPYYSIDSGVNWVPLSGSPDITIIDDVYTEYDYIQPGISSTNNLKFKMGLNTNDQSITPKIKDIRLLLY